MKALGDNGDELWEDMTKSAQPLGLVMMVRYLEVHVADDQVLVMHIK